jgi:predicted signal transduction protein with EAL and GGDEF domain
VELKLDRSYMSGCASDKTKQSVRAAAVQLALRIRSYGLRQGVENVEDLRTLIDLGCHSMQGFLFARPTDAVGFGKLLLGRAASKPPQGHPHGDVWVHGCRTERAGDGTPCFYQATGSKP